VNLLDDVQTDRSSEDRREGQGAGRLSLGGPDSDGRTSGHFLKYERASKDVMNRFNSRRDGYLKDEDELQHQSLRRRCAPHTMPLRYIRAGLFSSIGVWLELVRRYCITSVAQAGVPVAGLAASRRVSLVGVEVVALAGYPLLYLHRLPLRIPLTGTCPGFHQQRHKSDTSHSLLSPCRGQAAQCRDHLKPRHHQSLHPLKPLYAGISARHAQ